MRKPVSPVVGQRCLLVAALSLASFGLLTSCTEPPPKGAATERAQPTQSFAQWRDGFRAQALAAGISASTFDSAFEGIEPDESVVTADRSQPEFSRPVWQYLESAVSSARVHNGQDRLQQNAEVLQRIDATYGVEREAVVAIWGMESNFGQQMGSKNVIRSLATLAYEGRRPNFGRDQLIAALQILQHGDVPASNMIGSWAGAMGQTQFIPTTYNRYAVDFDGDGRRDIWGSSPDALASTANYLKSSGWQQGQSWGFEVRLPQGFDYAQADMDIRKPMNEWLRQGIKVASGNLPSDPQASVSLLLPAGYRGPAFLVTDNFRAILKYNNSTSYALAVGLLADSFRGGGQLAGSWPLEDTPLSRSERIELQQLLVQRGYQPGTADGIIGANTRKAIRAYQQSIGSPADGYPTPALLGQLRQKS
ncbi:lytic murein transglycosylase [Pseudomonas nitroreducens]|uniref:lytic murein transglycosylase n=1 Tax=Pseudomonas nitroreducens TaxID=46680 RepID=UPI001FB6E89F|nr:lytic murein transglycosylase [Pseudomonas nitroreducens]MCJ1881516.1 lytic murein transglycosylase [Pseudomonas nitroreducens]MCJ1897908.1 lytic murein transglycosylase [Pseudomonas nitroreducens]